MPKKDIAFRLHSVDPSGARRSSFRTEHGEVQCPAFMPVGTQGAVKAATPHQVEATGAQVILGNTFHLSLENRRELVKRAGGLHSFMAWSQTILTDSGGFQVFSLPNKTISDEGVSFRYTDDGALTVLDPEISMAIQTDLGADIVMAFDECVEFPSPREYVERSLRRTTAWAKRCREVQLADHQFLFGIIQGGTYQDLRSRSATEITEIPFDGFAIGGVSVGEGLDLLKDIVGHTAPLMPEHLPRYLMGVGYPEDIIASVERGMDMFDCVIPTRYARYGTLFTRTGRIRVTDKKYRKDRYPIDTACKCYTCQHFTRMVLRHLHYAGETLYNTLATIHNLHFYQDLMQEIRNAIEKNSFESWSQAWLARYRPEKKGQKPAPRGPRGKRP